MPASYYDSIVNMCYYAKDSLLTFFSTSSFQAQITFSNRKRTSFEANKAASIALPENGKVSKNSASTQPIAKQMQQLHAMQKATNDKNEIASIMLKKVELVAQQINEHAARRVDLFFYLAIALYGKHVVVKKDSTVKQNGKGSNKAGTQACHSSLFPNLKFETMNNRLLFFKSPTLSLVGTHFEESLNMTIELPQIVNNFDGSLEGKQKPTKYIETLTEVLNKTAKAELDPIQAMHEFFKTMHEFFKDYYAKHLEKDSIENSAAMKKVWEYEVNGTFIGNCGADYAMTQDYLYSRLRLTEVQQVLVEKDSNFYKTIFQKIQEEILSSKAIESQQHRKNP